MWQRWMAEVHLGCHARASASAQVWGMALRETHGSLMAVALCHKQLRGVRQLVPGDCGAAGAELPGWGSSASPIVAVWWLKPDEHFVFQKSQSMSLPPL